MTSDNDDYVVPRRGAIRSHNHPWNGYSGERIGTISTPVGDGYRIRLDNGLDCFVRPDEWRDAR